jgi:hypothetical protein
VAYLLRLLLLIMLAGLLLTLGTAHHLFLENWGHIRLAIPFFLYTLFAQAFVMFYFIGVSRLAKNVYTIVSQEVNLHELFDQPPTDLAPYKTAAHQFALTAELCKRQTIPWTMLMVVLGTIGFLMGGAHDTGLVEKTTHSGIVYGFSAACFIGFFRQWFFLGKSHKLLRKLKAQFSMSDYSM